MGDFPLLFIRLCTASISEMWFLKKKKKDYDIQVESKYKGLKLGLKVLENDMRSGQGKNPTRGGCPAGLTGHPRLPAAASSTLALYEAKPII